MRLARISLFCQSFLYLAGGINHFWHMELYVRIMPDHYTSPMALVKISGLAEILGGLGLLIPRTSRSAAFGIVALLAVFMDVHFYMLRHPERFPEIPYWVLLMRVPLQFVLMGWALSAARKQRDIVSPVAQE